MSSISISAARVLMLVRIFCLSGSLAVLSAMVRSSLVISLSTAWTPRLSMLMMSSNTNIFCLIFSAMSASISSSEAKMLPSVTLSIEFMISATASMPPTRLLSSVPMASISFFSTMSTSSMMPAGIMPRLAMRKTISGKIDRA
ncbi:MAG: hypothetical protein BWY87_01408 [Deltaproteobacteria bacterium ADurb.Bin510]|nr:MAG: hypothetical protein BWY87_01408 [Deltaproteobacteria bacterium ADurb.Bin510]